jgi:NAD(P)-dependent dehydrogenase (short-subunit alcohol dehydrogenase family)
MADHQEQQTRPVAIVTGASGGIGEASARALQAAGYRVLGTYRRPPATRSPGIEYLACDVTSDESVQTAIGQVLAKAGRIDLLVNNAGVGLVAGAEESSVEQAKSLFDVNLFGVFRLTNAVLPTMRRQGSGRIVNISSVMGLIPAPFMALYAASKHALEGYSSRWTMKSGPRGSEWCWSSRPTRGLPSRATSTRQTSSSTSIGRHERTRREFCGTR